MLPNNHLIWLEILIAVITIVNGIESFLHIRLIMREKIRDREWKERELQIDEKVSSILANAEVRNNRLVEIAWKIQDSSMSPEEKLAALKVINGDNDIVG